MGMEEEDEKENGTYVVVALGIVHATWRMVGFKISFAATRESKKYLKIRLEEEKT